MKIRSVILSLMSTIALLALVSCAALGLSQPKSFDEQLANAYGVHTAIASAAATAVTTGAITQAEGNAIETQVIATRELLDASRAIESTNPSGASTDLTLAVSGLAALQTYLNSKLSAPAQPAGGK